MKKMNKNDRYEENEGEIIILNTMNIDMNSLN